MSSENESVEGLIAALVANTREMAATAHVGRINRLFGQRGEIYAAIEALPDAAAVFSRQFEHPDPQIQLDVARYCKSRKINLEAALATLRRLAERRDSIGREAKSSLNFSPAEPSPATVQRTPRIYPFLPTPPGCDRANAEGMVRAVLSSEQAQEIIELLRPSIRIWPKKPASSPFASHFGGLPAVPPGWAWPFAEEEPFIFLAQINCAELGSLAKLHNLPDHGLLSFFGDHDEINGVPANGGAVFYFEDLSRLAIAHLPMQEDEPLITCGMDFYETYELPDPCSNEIGALDFDEERGDIYFDLYVALAQFGFTKDEHLDENDISKLAGRPDLVQNEDVREGSMQLLLQLGQFRDGTEHVGWGPGGLLYYVIHPDNLAAKAFDLAELTMQCT